MSDPAPPPMAPAEDPAPLVSIIVVSYNTREMTLEALRSVAAETSVPHEIILVDNASSDGSAEAIAAEFPDVRLIASAENHGFAKANNLAAREARAPYLLLLNPDTVVLDRAIDRLMAFAARTPEARIWGGRTLYGDRSLNAGSCNALPSFWTAFCRTTGLAVAFKRSPRLNPEDYGGWDRSTEREVGYVCGCLLLIGRDFWNELGGFDLTFVMYGEDADLCARARALGARPRITPEATIVHYVGASTKRRSNKDMLILKAKITLVRRHLPRWRQAPTVFMLRMWPLTRKLGGQTLALAGRGSGAAETAGRWAAVWAERASWQDGFPPLPHPLPAEPAR